MKNLLILLTLVLLSISCANPTLKNSVADLTVTESESILNSPKSEITVVYNDSHTVLYVIKTEVDTLISNEPIENVSSKYEMVNKNSFTLPIGMFIYLISTMIVILIILFVTLLL